MSYPGVLHRLLRKFMGGQVVFLIGVRHRNAMGVRGQFVKFRRALMRIVRHVPSLDAWFISVLIMVDRCSSVLPLNCHNQLPEPVVRRTSRAITGTEPHGKLVTKRKVPSLASNAKPA
jgi:hypothetical protein